MCIQHFPCAHMQASTIVECMLITHIQCSQIQSNGNLHEQSGELAANNHIIVLQDLDVHMQCCILVLSTSIHTHSSQSCLIDCCQQLDAKNAIEPFYNHHSSVCSYHRHQRYACKDCTHDINHVQSDQVGIMLQHVVVHAAVCLADMLDDACTHRWDLRLICRQRNRVMQCNDCALHVHSCIPRCCSYHMHALP